MLEGAKARQEWVKGLKACEMYKIWNLYILHRFHILYISSLRTVCECN